MPMGQGSSGYVTKTMGGKSYSVNTTNAHTISVKGLPNSVTQKLDSKGNIEKERYYDSKGNPLVDIDYTNHPLQLKFHFHN